MSPDTVTEDHAPPEPALPRAAEDPDIVGFVDSIAGNRVAGWVWNRKAPDERLEVEIRLDNETVATVCADQPRDDLVRGGVGDGAHGFECRLEEQVIKQERHRVSAFVHYPGMVGEVRLKNVAAINAGELALSSSDFARLIEQVDQCISDQRAGFRWLYRELQQLNDVLRNGEVGPGGAAAGPVISETPSDVMAALRDIDAQIGTLAQEQHGITEALAEIAEAGRTRDRRLGEVEVFNARLEAVMAEVKSLRQEAPPVIEGVGLKRLVFVLGGLTAVSLVTGIVAILT